jgi:hypothetical protein
MNNASIKNKKQRKHQSGSRIMNKEIKRNNKLCMELSERNLQKVHVQVVFRSVWVQKCFEKDVHLDFHRRIPTMFEKNYMMCLHWNSCCCCSVCENGFCVCVNLLWIKILISRSNCRIFHIRIHKLFDELEKTQYSINFIVEIDIVCVWLCDCMCVCVRVKDRGLEYVNVRAVKIFIFYLKRIFLYSFSDR